MKKKFFILINIIVLVLYSCDPDPIEDDDIDDPIGDIIVVENKMEVSNVSVKFNSDNNIYLSWTNPDSADFEGTFIDITIENSPIKISLELDKTHTDCILSNFENGKSHILSIKTKNKDKVLSKGIEKTYYVNEVKNLNSRTDFQKIVLFWENPKSSFDNVSLKILDNNGNIIEDKTLSKTTKAYNFETVDKVPGFYTFIIKTTNNKKGNSLGVEEEVFYLDSDLPIVFIDTPLGIPLDSKDWINKKLGLGMSTFSIENSGGYDIDSVKADIRGRGNYTWTLEKKPFNLTLSTELPLLGMSSHKKWTFLANHYDKSLLRTEFAFGLGRRVFDRVGWVPRTESVELVLNGKYEGVYQLVEKIELDSNRLDINYDKNDKENSDFLIEVDVRLDRDFWFYTTQGVPITFREPDSKLEDIVETWKTKIQDIEDYIFSETYLTAEVSSMTMFDIHSFIDWYLLNEFVKNNDSNFTTSVNLYYKKSEEKLYMGPIWDYDVSSGNGTYDDLEKAEGFRTKTAIWYTRLFENENFSQAVRTRWNNKSHFLQDEIDGIAGLAYHLEIGQRNNFLRWNFLESFRKRSWTLTYDDEVQEMIRWLNARKTWLNSNL